MSDNQTSDAIWKRRRDDYELYRDRMEHEDTLVGQRITWLVSSQAFLLTPYVLLYTKTVDVLNDTVSTSSGLPVQLALGYLGLLTLATYTVVYIGVLSCLIPFRSTAAAIQSMCELTYDFTLEYEPADWFEPGINATRKEGIQGLYAPRHLPLLSAAGWGVLSFIPAVTFNKLLSLHQVQPTEAYWCWTGSFDILVVGCLALVAWVFRESRREAETSSRIIDCIKALDADVPGLQFLVRDRHCTVAAGIVPAGPYGSFPEGAISCEIVHERAGEIVASYTGQVATLSSLEKGDSIKARYKYKAANAGAWSRAIIVLETKPLEVDHDLIRPSKVRVK